MSDLQEEVSPIRRMSDVQEETLLIPEYKIDIPTLISSPQQNISNTSMCILHQISIFVCALLVNMHKQAYLQFLQ